MPVFIIIKRSQLLMVLAVVILVIFLVIFLAVPKAIFTSSKALPIFQGDTEKKAVAFCINVAWGNEYIPTILETLKTNDVKGTFFFIGTWVRDFSDLGRKIADAGHEIANHGYSHVHPKNLSKTNLQKLIEDNEAILLKEFGRASKIFSPPYGEFNSNIVNAATEMGYKTVMWTLDTIDWQNPNSKTYLDRIVPNLTNGALILMHPTEVTANTLGTLIKEIKSKGYGIITVSEIL